MTKTAVTDRPALAFNGYLALIISLAVLISAVVFGLKALMQPLSYGGPDIGNISLYAILAVLALYSLSGTYTLQPNEAAVLQLFGAYSGTDDTPGLRWTIPLFSRVVVSRRLQTQEVGPLKVNDRSGNPIEVGAVVVWRVFDAARAVLQVDNYRQFVSSQAETGLRHLAGSYPYDSWSTNLSHVESTPVEPTAVVALRDGGEALVNELTHQVAQRLAPAGIAVNEARFTHLAYAPEIAQAMLRPQQASAVIAAREIIAQGAVSIAVEAAQTLAKQGIHYDDQEKARMISNILTVLVSDKDASPVLNIGASRSSS